MLRRRSDSDEVPALRTGNSKRDSIRIAVTACAARPFLIALAVETSSYDTPSLPVTVTIQLRTPAAARV